MIADRKQETTVGYFLAQKLVFAAVFAADAAKQTPPGDRRGCQAGMANGNSIVPTAVGRAG
jgi:hypothetical protein